MRGGQDNEGNEGKMPHLPTRICMLVVEKVVSDPLVDGIEGHFVLVVIHCHADKSRVRKGRFDTSVGLVVYLFLCFFILM